MVQSMCASVIVVPSLYMFFFLCLQQVLQYIMFLAESYSAKEILKATSNETFLWAHMCLLRGAPPSCSTVVLLCLLLAGGEHTFSSLFSLLLDISVIVARQNTISIFIVA